MSHRASRSRSPRQNAKGEAEEDDVKDQSSQAIEGGGDEANVDSTTGDDETDHGDDVMDDKADADEQGEAEEGGSESEETPFSDFSPDSIMSSDEFWDYLDRGCRKVGHVSDGDDEPPADPEKDVPKDLVPRTEKQQDGETVQESNEVGGVSGQRSAFDRAQEKESPLERTKSEQDCCE